MSKIALKSNPLGTGTFTIESPDSNTDRTVVLPDVNATLLTDSAGVLNIGSGQLYKDASGNVGIGTSSPSRLVEIVAGSPALYLVSSNTTGNASVQFGDTDDDNRGRIIYNNTDDSMAFSTSALERMRITSAGNVGIGTSAPGARLDVSGNVQSNTDKYSGFNVSLATTDELVITFTVGGFNSASVFFMANFGSTSENTRRGFIVPLFLGYRNLVVGTTVLEANYTVSTGFSVTRTADNTFQAVIKHQGGFVYNQIYSNFSIRGSNLVNITSVTSRTKT